MSEGDIDVGAEKSWKYKSWYHDPEQVENLVTLLGAKTQDTAEGPKRWKYVVGHAYDVLFPMGNNQREAKYAEAPVPSTVDSFETTAIGLASGRMKFGPKISAGLVERFHEVMQARQGRGMVSSEPRRKFWTNDKRVIAVGLMDYCSLRGADVEKIFQEKLGREFRDKGSIYSATSRWRMNKEFPFEDSDRLRQNTKLATMFVEELRIVMKMTLGDLRSWLVAHNPKIAEDPDHQKLEKLDDFIRAHERYRAREDNASSAPEQTR